MNESFVLDAVIEAVPQWYQGSQAPWMDELCLKAERRTICAHIAPSPQLGALLCFIKDNLAGWHTFLGNPVSPTRTAALRKAITLEWLRLTDESVDWPLLLAYMEYLKDRTHENCAVSCNLLIVPEEVKKNTVESGLDTLGTSGKVESSTQGGVDITSLHAHKTMDLLANSDRVYFKVDPSLRFLGYEEISWDQVREAQDYTYSVDFLHFFSHAVAEGNYLAHLTKQREIVILGKKGLLATERHNRWHVYNSSALRSSMVDIFADRNVAYNLFELISDLSYKRHGALLVYDPYHTVVKEVINRESVFAPEGTPDEVHLMLAPVAEQISLGHSSRGGVKKRIFMEWANLDGAVIFDADRILAFGAMIRTHPDAGGVVGARTTAALSAYLDGGTTVKISADGDAYILFSEAENGGPRTRESATLQSL